MIVLKPARYAVLNLFLALFLAGGASAADSVKSRITSGIEPALVVDVAEGSSEAESRPRSFLYDADLGLTFFAATTPATGTELWSYDGVEARQIADLCVGPCSSNPRMLVNEDGKVFFAADDGVFGRELWASDGSAEGTIRLADACPGPCSSIDRWTSAVIVQGYVVFPAEVAQRRDGSLRALWASDGTPEGTSSAFALYPDVCDGRVWFVRAGTDTVYWSCDSKVFAVRAGDEKPQMIFEGSTTGMEVLGDELFFLGSTPEYGRELWRSDGTLEGTSLVVDFTPGADWGMRFIHGVFDGYVYLEVEPTGALYRANEVGLQLISSRQVVDLAVAEDRVFFTHNYFDSSSNDWRTQLRTAQGPGTDRLLLDALWNPSYLRGSVSSGGKLFFFSANAIWTSDGTAGGTAPRFPLGEITVYTDFTAGFRILTATTPGDVVFSAANGRGFELWASDGTEEGTKEVADLVSRTPDSGEPEDLTMVGDRVVFTGGGQRVWSTDGTPEGSFRIEDGPQNPRAFYPHQVAGEARLFYGGDYGTSVSGIWSTDGTTTEPLVEGLRLLQFAEPLVGGGFLLEAGGENSGEVGLELWTSDLTDEGTEFLAELSPGFGGVLSPPLPLSADVVESIVLKEQHILAARNTFSNPGAELWGSDGTPAGTVALESCEDYSDDCLEPRDLTRVRRHFVVFSGFDAAKGRELWRTNGTPAGTRRIKDLLPGGESSNPHDFVRIRPARVLFFALNENGGESLWRTSGSPGGTREIVDLSIDDRPSFVLESELIGDRLYFVLANETTGAELWVTDGTAAGTRLVHELIEGPGSSDVRNLTAYGDWLIFTARDAESGLELWASDGTANGTFLVHDLAPGEASSTPEMIRVVDDAVYFRADDGETGRELWVINP